MQKSQKYQNFTKTIPTIPQRILHHYTIILTRTQGNALPYRLARRRGTRRPVLGIIGQDRPDRKPRPGDLRRMEAVLPEQRLLRKARLWYLEIDGSLL